MSLRAGSLIRAAGAAASAVLPRRSRVVRAVLLGASDIAARQFDPGAVQLLSIDAHGDVNLLSTGTTPATDRYTALSEATAALSWALAAGLVGMALRPLPLPARIVASGAAAYAAGELLDVARQRFGGDDVPRAAAEQVATAPM